MAYTTIIEGKWVQDRADSFGDVLDFIANNPRARGWEVGMGSEYPGQYYGTSNLGTPNFAAADNLARHGWPEGAAKMLSSLGEAKLFTLSNTHKSESLDVAGMYPCVPAYISGAPDCMVNIGTEQRAAKPIIRLLVNVGYLGFIKAKTIINRGAAILSWADKLEAEGARVEIIVLRSTKTDGYTYSMTFPLKRADEPLEIDRAAFVIAHPSMLRRIAFAAAERHGHLQPAFGNHGCVSSNEEPKAWQEPHSIYFNALREEDENARYATAEKAAHAVKGIIMEGLSRADIELDAGG